MMPTSGGLTIQITACACSKALKLIIQGQETAANEAKQNLLEKERRIAVLEMELKVRASRSEVVRLRAALEEKETVLTNTLTENQTLKAQLNKGAELYKEEIEDLKTQLAKADMAQIKESKRFGWELANAKALVEQRDEQLRKVKEELRSVQLEQDVTVVHGQDVPQPPLPITCGGGSGIVQSTQMLVLNAERAKLAREVGRLKTENELLLTEKAEAGDKSLPWKSDRYSISQADGVKTFQFDRVFQAEENTSAVYNEVADPIIKSAIQGYHGTIFAYGQTASGKTHTMLGTESSPGILRMGIEDVFRTICGTPDREFLLRISYMEIYNETIKDLLCNDITKKKPLVVREDINRTVYVEDLIEEVVVSPEEAMRWLQKGEKNRHYGETKMSAKSSRSHTIFRMAVFCQVSRDPCGLEKIIESKEDDSSSSDGDGAVMVSHLVSFGKIP
uniref:Uncharacterized protein n=1 Tax=Sphaerodactylus townsendi TaxID=933632 RepID=A0ACB8G088_9SAUR